MASVMSPNAATPSDVLTSSLLLWELVTAGTTRWISSAIVFEDCCVSKVLWSFSFTQVLWSVSSSISSALPFFLLVRFTGKLAVLTAVQQVQLGEGQCSSNSVCFLYIKLVILSERLGLFDLLMQ